MNLLLVILLIVIVRLSSVFVVQTYYVPDEYWQSLEVAHKLVFGYGYLTWEWIQGIRSYVYPLAIASVYKILALLNLDNVNLLIILPRILQALLSAYSDYRFFVWMGKKKWALFLIIVPWFWYYICSRTLTNTLETSLTTIALSYYPWHGESVAYLWPATLCCFLRPTAAIVWIPLCIFHICNTRLPLKLIAKQFLLIGLLVAALCISVDTYLHGKLVVTPYEFLKYNVFHNIGSFYGSHPWFWYFTVGLPTVLGVTSVPFFFAIIDTVRSRDAYPIRKQLLITITVALIALSTIKHKEFRFVAFLMPLCLYITSDTLTRWSYKASRITLWLIALALFIGNALPAWYLSTTHQKGPIEVMSSLQEIARDYRDENNNRAKILFLMPCHSTPYYSHVHVNVTMRFLTCEPNLQNIPDYKDEAEEFYDAPVRWLHSHIPIHPRTAMPTHIVLYQPLDRIIHEFLTNYKELHKIENVEVNGNVVAQFLLNDWSTLLKGKQLSGDSLLQYVRGRSGKHILVYQRLRIDEENTFNREEYQINPDAHTNANNKDEQNLFN